MRIGIVTGEYPPMEGGIGAHCRTLARTLAEQGHNVYVFSTRQAENRDPGIEVSNKLKNWGPGSLSAVKRWATANQLDVVNIHYQTAAYGMSPWIHFLPQYVRSRVPVVTTFHDLRFPYLFPKAGRLRDWMVMHLAQSSSGAIVTNHEDLQRLSHLPRTALIPIGSSIPRTVSEEFDPQRWRELAGAQQDDFFIIHFGFVNHSKGLEILLEGMAALRTDGIPVRLAMIGGRTGSSDPTNAAYAERISEQISALGLSPHIYWSGFVDDAVVSGYLAASHAIVLPYLDGASYRRSSLMAAIHHGCTIVTTTPPAPIANFIDGANMLLVPPGNSKALADALRWLYESPVLRQRLRQGALQLARQFDWPQIANDHIAFFEQIIGAGV